MPKKKSFALRLNAELMQALEKWAADEFRSTNGQIEWIVHQALKEAGRLPKPSQKKPDDNEGLDKQEDSAL
ncbi:MAG: Arc family DNA-binding protein [Bernardetiaceae bacterium]|nr:Arc family DNA-binding protein [Bernardetiaceae bacterium]